MNVEIEETWKQALKPEFTQPYFLQLVEHIKLEKQMGQVIYPKGSHIFQAFKLTPLPQVKVVILGQDPYHNPNQAMGLSFSVPQGVGIPPSLMNIYKELQQDVGMSMPIHGDLTNWATQGVLLLNAVLTVRANEPASHSKLGWTNFTNQVIKIINEQTTNVVFLLWGKFAQEKISFIDTAKHLVLKAAHPSPLSAYNGFFGCQHFSKTNAYLVANNKHPINWSV